MSDKKYVLVTSFGQVPIDEDQYKIVKKFQGKADNVWVQLSDSTGVYQRAILGLFLNQEWLKEQDEDIKAVEEDAKE